MFGGTVGMLFGAGHTCIRTCGDSGGFHRRCGGYYGVLREKINVAGLPTRRAYKPGEAALWIRENALYLFFGPTPASLATDTPMITSAGVGLGRLKSFSDLDQLPAVAEMSLQIKK